ncbi:MAG: YbhN family protein [Gammaproteobacteria bacterium]|nr:YbhN family protein [Gammaproteobacteria bacterium]
MWSKSLRARTGMTEGTPGPVPAKRSPVQYFRYLLALLFCVAGLVYVSSEWDEFRHLQWPSPLPVTLVSLGFVLSLAVRSTYNWLVARHLGSGISAGESFLISSISTAGNLLLPVGAGVGLRAAYMKRAHGFPITHFAGGMIVFALLNLLVVSCIALLILIGVSGSAQGLSVSLLTMFAVPILLVLALTIIGKIRREMPSGSAGGWWTTFWQGLTLVVGDRRLVAVSVALVIANFVIACVTWTVALRDYSADIRIDVALLIAASQVISGFLNVTPGAVGIQEVTGLYVGRSLNTTVIELFAVLLWVRGVRLMTAIAIAVPSTIILQRRWGRA